ILVDILEADHRRLESLLAAAGDDIEPTAFADFRKGLLRHIGMEEKILFPAARAADETISDRFNQARQDHMRLVALLVQAPTRDSIGQIQRLLRPHNEMEEGANGLYAICEAAIGPSADEVAHRLRAAGEVPVRPYSNRHPRVLSDE